MLTDFFRRSNERMLMYFKWICQPFEQFVEHFFRNFLDVQTDDERIMNSLTVQTDNR